MFPRDADATVNQENGKTVSLKESSTNEVLAFAFNYEKKHIYQKE